MSPYDVTGLQSLSVDKVLLRRYRQGHFYLIFDMSPRGHRWGYMPASSHPYQVTVTLWRSGTWRRNVHSTLLNGLWRLDLLRGYQDKNAGAEHQAMCVITAPISWQLFYSSPTECSISTSNCIHPEVTATVYHQLLTNYDLFSITPHTLTTVFHIDNYYNPLLSAIILNTNCYNTHNQLQY